MIGEDIVASQKAVQLNRIETVGTGVGTHCMHDEIDIIRELFDLRVMSVCPAVFDRQRMEMKDVQKHMVIRFRRCFHVYPNYGLVVFQKFGKLVDHKSLFNFVRTSSIKE